MNKKGEIRLTSHSCIKLEVIREDSPPTADWIFFSSPSGVHLYVGHFGLPRNTHVAVLGEGTERALRTYGLNPDFSPGVSEPEVAIQQFCQGIGMHHRVLIPRSTISLQRFKGVLADQQLLDWPFYSNSPIPPQEAFSGDVLVFTSPSNAESYFSKHSLGIHQRVVAIGNATYTALLGCGIDLPLKSAAPTEAAMWEVIKAAFLR